MALPSQLSEVCRLVFEAVNENSISKFTLALRTYSPINLLTSLAQRNEEGETPLLVAMKMKNVSMIDELVNWISKKDFYQNEECRLLFIIIDQLSHNIPIMELLEYLISDVHCNIQESIKWLKFMAQVFVKSTSFTRQDKIIALEIVGACLITSLCYSYFSEESVCGLECWREAMTLRNFPATDDEPILPKTPAVCVPSAATSEVFGSTVEVTMMEELEILQEDFDRNYLLLDGDARLPCVKRMQIQALLVIRRISTQANLRHPFWLYLKSLVDFADVLETAEMRESKLIINTYLLILEQMNGFDPKMISRQLLHIFMDTLNQISNFFRQTLHEPPGSPGREELTYANLLAPSEFLNIITRNFPGNPDFDDCPEIMYSFLLVLDSISLQITNQELQKLEKLYCDCIRYSPEGTTTVLHFAADGHPPGEDFRLDIIKMILKLGCDPNVVDEFGETPLHILAEIDELHLEGYLLVFQTLVNAGGHLDQATNNGDTVLCILKRSVMRYNRRGMIVHPYFKSVMNTVFPLSCYAARVIRRNGIRFDGDRLPPPLQKFVQRHSAKEFIDYF